LTSGWESLRFNPSGICSNPDNFCDPASAKYRDRYAEIARRPTQTELDDSWRHARELGLKFETATFES
jgi:putative pyruvate formate lyase activating enzyme